MELKNKFKNIDLFNFFIFCACFISFLKTNNYLLLLIISVSFFIFFKNTFNNKKWILILFFIFFIMVIFYIFRNILYIDYNNSPFFYIRNIMIQHVNDRFKDVNKEFILLLLFNIKDYKSELYQNIVSLNIVQLFVISGFHIQILITIIKKLFKKSKIIEKTLSWSIVLFLLYILNFSLSILRVVIEMVYKHIFKSKLDRIQITSLTGISMMLLNIKNTYSYSFYLIFISLFSIHIINLFIKKRIIATLLVNAIVFISLMPIIISFNEKVNLLSLFFSFVFSPFIIFLFFIILFFAFIPGCEILVTFFIKLVVFLIDASSKYNQFLSINKNLYFNILFYSSWFLTINYFYKIINIRKTNKFLKLELMF